MKPLNWARKYADPGNLVDRTIGGNARFGVPRGISVPKGTGKDDAFSERHSVVKPVCTWSFNSNVVGGDFNHDIRIYTPSTRLRVKIVLTYEGSDNSVDPSGFLAGGEGQPWVVNAMARNPTTGMETILQRAYPAEDSDLATTLTPDSYELDTAAELLQVRTTTNSADVDSGDDPVNINLMLHVTWEPNTDIPTPELRRLYSLCQVTLNSPRLIQKGGS